MLSQLIRSIAFETVITFLVLALAPCYLLYRKRKISPFMYFAFGIYLIAVALGLASILGSLDAVAKFKLTASEYEVASLHHQVALYIFPFLSAAIGTNLITTAIAENKKPKSTFPVSRVK